MGDLIADIHTLLGCHVSKTCFVKQMWYGCFIKDIFCNCPNMCLPAHVYPVFVEKCAFHVTYAPLYAWETWCQTKSSDDLAVRLKVQEMGVRLNVWENWVSH